MRYITYEHLVKADVCHQGRALFKRLFKIKPAVNPKKRIEVTEKRCVELAEKIDWYDAMFLFELTVRYKYKQALCAYERRTAETTNKISRQRSAFTLIINDPKKSKEARRKALDELIVFDAKSAKKMKRIAEGQARLFFRFFKEQKSLYTKPDWYNR